VPRQLGKEPSPGTPPAAIDLRDVDGARARQFRQLSLGHAAMLAHGLDRVSPVQDRRHDSIGKGLGRILQERAYRRRIGAIHHGRLDASPFLDRMTTKAALPSFLMICLVILKPHCAIRSK
jgi:hypothetical protein